MMAKNNRYERFYTYNDGNTVRKAYAEPAYIPEPERRPVREPEYRRSRKTRIATQTRARKNREKAKLMNPGFVAFLAVASMAFLIACAVCLHTQAAVTNNSESVQEMTAQLNELRTANDTTEASINSSVDINHVYDVATNELGMVYPDQSHVVTYDSSTSEYVVSDDTID